MAEYVLVKLSDLEEVLDVDISTTYVEIDVGGLSKKAKISNILSKVGLDEAISKAAGLSTKNVFTDKTESTSPSTGSLVIEGGVGAKHIFVEDVPDTADGKQVVNAAWIYRREREKIRNTIESSSNGKQTVVWTPKGQASYFYIQPAFNLQDANTTVGTGIHPMFIINGEQKRERLLGVYAGSIQNGELVSVPNVDAAVSTNFESFVSLAKANGAGWGLMTNTDWAGIGLICFAAGVLPRGNTSYGKSNLPFETGLRVDSAAPGTQTGVPRVLLGSGTNHWRHNDEFNGISDLSGNVWELTPGIRLVDGEVQLIENNDSANIFTDFGTTSSAWKSINGETGELVQPGHPNAVKFANTGTSPYTLVRESGQTFEGLTNPSTTPVSEAAKITLLRYGIYPLADRKLGSHGIWITPNGERIVMRGGDWGSGYAAGIFALSMGLQRNSINSSVGARPAFVV